MMNIKIIVLILIYGCAVSLGIVSFGNILRQSYGAKNKKALKVLIPVLVMLLMMMFPLVGALLPDGPADFFFQKWGNIFIGLILYFFGVLLVLWLIRLILFAFIKKEKGDGFKQRSSKILIILPTIISLILNISGSINARDVKITEYNIPMEQLSQTRPLRIALIADLHIGVNSTTKLYEDMAEKINSLEPDIVLVGGDIITSSYGAMRDPKSYSDILSRISSKYGVYAVYGNHDVDEPLLGGFTYMGQDNPQRHPEMDGFIRNCGWTLLEDETIVIEELNHLTIAGRRDEKRPGDGLKQRASLEELLNNTDKDSPVILLEHEPADLDTMGDTGVDLALSGHTHDGQIFPGNILTRIISEQSYGLKAWGDAMACVTSGVGFYGPPLRIGTISEIVVIDLN